MTWTHQRVVNSSQGIGSMKISHFSKMPYCVKWWWLKLTFGVISQRPFSKLQDLLNLPGMTRDFKWMKFVLSQILVFQAHLSYVSYNSDNVRVVFTNDSYLFKWEARVIKNSDFAWNSVHGQRVWPQMKSLLINMMFMFSNWNLFTRIDD